MEKQSFTPTGLQQLLAQIYALSPVDIATQSQALMTDPKTWIQDHFLLNAHQQHFLDHLPVATLAFLGDQGSFAIANHLPITLIQQGNLEDEGKLFTPMSSFQQSSDSQGRTQSYGEMTLLVSYGESLGQSQPK